MSLIDDTMVEAIGKILYEGDRPDYDPPWERLNDDIRAHFCKKTRTALQAVEPMIGSALIGPVRELIFTKLGDHLVADQVTARIRELTGAKG